jgi:hypothetical protein
MDGALRAVAIATLGRAEIRATGLDRFSRATMVEGYVEVDRAVLASESAVVPPAVATRSVDDRLGLRPDVGGPTVRALHRVAGEH